MTCDGSYKLGDSRCGNWFFKSCIIKKLHDKITIDISYYLGCVKNTRSNMDGFVHYLSCLIGGEWKILFVDK